MNKNNEIKSHNEELKEFILSKEKEENCVCINNLFGISIYKINEFIEQPTEGLLYDLNLLPEVILSQTKSTEWINKYAIMLIIKKLKENINDLKN